MNNLPPTANAGLDQTVYRNDIVSLAGTWTDPTAAYDNPYAWTWDVTGDAVVDFSGSASYGDAIAETTVFALEGFYTLTFDVTDKDNGNDNDTVVIEVLNRSPDCTQATPSQVTIWPPNTSSCRSLCSA